MTQHRDKNLEAKIKQTQKYSIIDGSAYNVMAGFGEQYLIPFALRLGASSSEIGLLSSFPYFIGSLFQLLGAKLTDEIKSRKKLIVIFVLLQAFAIIPLFLLPILTKNTLLLIGLFTLYVIFGNITGPPWNSLIGDIVKEEERATFFGFRNKIIIIVFFISVLVAGLILHFLSDFTLWGSFGLLFGIAFIARIVSWIFLKKHYEPEYIVMDKKSITFTSFLSNVFKTNFGNFVAFRSLISLAVLIASPFFAVYMLKHLNFSYLKFTMAIMVPQITRGLTMTYWGKYINTFGTRNIMLVSIVIICLIPLLWFGCSLLFEHKTFIFYIILLIESLSGFGWGGVELTSFNYMLETSTPERRAKQFAYFNVVWGTCILFGGLIGASLVKTLPDAVWGISSILLLFFFSSLLRTVVSLIFIPRIEEIKVKQEIKKPKLVYEMIMGKPLNYALNRTNSKFIYASRSIRELGYKLKDKVMPKRNSKEEE
ncbi:MFS transporter [bacterium]|nr:MFS transporter [bacterium]